MKPPPKKTASARHSAGLACIAALLCLLVFYHQGNISACQHHHIRLSTSHSGLKPPQQQAVARSATPATSSESLDRGLAAAPSLHRDAWAWLQFAVADAAAAGTAVSAQCAELQGLPFLQRWTSTCSRVCGGDPTTPAQQPASSVACCGYPVNNTGVACRADNLVVDTAAFLGPPVPKGEEAHDKYMPAGGPGSVQLNCLAPQPHEGQPGKVVWQDKLGLSLEHEHLPWFKAAAVHNTSSTHICSGPGAHTVTHPVMFVTRLDTTNPYHHTQSLVQAFLSMAVFNASTLPPFQVIIADHFDAGPFTEIWRRVSHPFPVVSLSSFARATSQPTCFTKSMQAHYAPPNATFLGYEGVGSEHACPSHILMAAAHWQRHLFKEILPSAEQREYEVLEATQLRSNSHVSGQPPAAEPAAEPAAAGLAPNASEPAGVSEAAAASVQQRRLHVVWLSRSWFGRSMRAGGGLTEWQESRDLAHELETEIVKALEKAVLDWNSKACVQPTFGWWQKPQAVQPQTDCKPTNVTFDFRFVELSLEDLYPDQVELLTRTAVLVGIHGAALTNQMLMRPHRGAVVEFGAGGTGGAAGNFHYSNMANSLGHKHFRLDDDASADAIASAAHLAMDHVSSKY